MTSYAPMGGDRFSIIPNGHLAPAELVFFRIYQGTALAQWMYYCSFLVSIMFLVNRIYRGSLTNGAGGAILGTVSGLVYGIAFILMMRLVLEVCMSLFELRDTILTRNEVQHAPAPVPTVVPAVTVAEAPIIIGETIPQNTSTTTTTYQGYQTSSTL
ncbi:hypothetical protein Pelo_8712 [Pelomyxa schiedti]|nr:hypothetical protein Pelo_8712 [Pelomyxa schiedti]